MSADRTRSVPQIWGGRGNRRRTAGRPTRVGAARALRRTIQQLVENEVSRMLLNGDTEPGDRVTVGLTQGDLHFDVERHERR